MKKILFLITLIMLVIFNGCAEQNKMKIEDIVDVWIYDYFDTKGYTVGEVYRKFRMLEDSKTSKIQLNFTFVDSLKNMLMYSAKCKRLLPSKCGTKLIFTQFVMKDGSSRNIIINSVGVVDYFTGYMIYFFTDSSDKKDKTLWMNDFWGKIIKYNIPQISNKS
ncbi:MAG: hypothetical protein LBF01_03910 [Bacteroidales bacterium]|jgi:hypothetical protein|nr:hypothetical protein [Bacteroidales bacterium]